MRAGREAEAVETSCTSSSSVVGTDRLRLPVVPPIREEAVPSGRLHPVLKQMQVWYGAACRWHWVAQLENTWTPCEHPRLHVTPEAALECWEQGT